MRLDKKRGDRKKGERIESAIERQPMPEPSSKTVLSLNIDSLAQT
jgi:hypothetical protein